MQSLFLNFFFLAIEFEDSLSRLFKEEGKKELPPFSEQLEKMVFYLIISLVILFISLYVLKKFQTKSTQKKNAQSLFNIVETRTLSPKTTLYLVEIQGKGIVFSEGENGITPLTSFPLQPLLPETDSPSSFGDKTI